MNGGEGPEKKLTKLQTLLLVLFGATIVAAILTAVLVVTGVVSALPQAELRTVGLTLEPWLVVGIVLFVHIAFFGILSSLFTEEIREKIVRARKQWSNLPDVVRSILVGLPFTVVAALAVSATDLLATSLSALVRLAVPLITWILVAAVSFDYLQSADRLAALNRQLWTGVAVGVGVTAAVILLDRFADSVDTPGYAPLVVLFVASGVSATLLIRSARREHGYLTKLLVKTGFAQVRRIQTVTVALGLGLLIGVIGALLVSEAGGGILPTLLAFLIVWGVATIVTLYWFRETDVAYSDLVITDIRERSSGRRRELVVANRRDDRVDLKQAKIRDTEHDLYRTNVNVVLAPGQTETFDLPPDFSLFPSADDFATDLPLGFVVSKGTEAPVVVTRDGEKFKLRWGEGVPEAAGHADPDRPKTGSSDGDHRE